MRSTRVTCGMVAQKSKPPLNSGLSSPPLRDAILLAAIISTFEDLGVSVSLRTPEGWYPFHSVANVAAFEIAHGAEMPRWAYNDRCYRQVLRKKKGVLGVHAGFSDLFVPVADGGQVKGVLVAGPFSVTRPTSAEVMDRWRWLSGRQGRSGDPDFSEYVTMTLSTLTVEGTLSTELASLLECFSALLGGEHGASRLEAEIASARTQLKDARFAERMWEASRTMVHEGMTGAWRSAAQIDVLAALGLKRLPEHVVVGLLLGRSKETDPVDEMFKRDAFQRECVSFARKVRGVVCLRIADHGVALLIERGATGSRLRTHLLEVGVRASSLAKRFGLRLHLGVSAAGDGGPLPTRYQAALSAAERALSQGLSVAHAESGLKESHGSLNELRRQLAETPAESPGHLSPRFERYVEAAAVRCHYRLEATRAHLEAGFDQVVDALGSAGSLDAKSAAGLRARIEKDAADASTIRELSTAYRSVISDLEVAIVRPTEGRQDRSIRRAAAFVRDHLGDPLTLAQVSRVAGFAPRYFSKLFVHSERMTFRRYLRQVRLASAKQLLLSTTLSVDRIAKLCGFRARVHFHRAFKATFRMTPVECRKDRALDGTLQPARSEKARTARRRRLSQR